jgi:hypothetical protein
MQYKPEIIVRGLYQGLFGRAPGRGELEIGTSHLEQQPTSAKALSQLINRLTGGQEYKKSADPTLQHKEIQRVDDVITGLALNQVRFWLEHGVPSQDRMLDFFENRMRSREDLALYRFGHRGVELVVSRDRVVEDLDQRVENFRVRALIYLRLFRQIFRPKDSGTPDRYLAMSMHDGPMTHPEVPFFASQKPKAANNILLPDIDLLASRSFADLPPDDLRYLDKSTTAVFAGSTTGVPHTLESVAALSNRRLRSAVFFKDRPDVDFRITAIIQCLEPEAEAAIRKLNVSREKITWEEHQKHKFIISIDGNGATFGRVYKTLRSNSVLVKYKSQHMLYYFDALIPSVHYLEVEDDEEVLRIIQAEKVRPGLFASVARAGTDLAYQLLNERAVRSYARKVLRLYFSLFET